MSTIPALECHQDTSFSAACEVVFYDLIILLIAASQDDHLSITMARTVANENSLGLVCMPAAEVILNFRL